MEILLARRFGDPTLNIHVLWHFCWLIAVIAATGWSQDNAGRPAKPYFDARQQQTEYVGPAGPQRSVDEVAEIKIGYFGPSDPEDPNHGSLWRAATLAIDQANRDGGLHGKPFRLVSAWAKDPWGTGVKRLTQLVYRERVWVVVGGVDGPTTHLAEQVVAKARLALIGPLCTDKTVNLANVPWMFSLAPGDHLIVKALAPQIAEVAESQTFVVIAANDHDSFLLVRELRKALDQRHVIPTYQLTFKPGSASQQIDKIIHTALSARPVALLVIADANDSLRVVQQLRRAGFDRCVFGGPSFGRHQFFSQVADVAGDLRFPLISQLLPQSATNGSLPESFPHDADFATYQMYDAVRMAVEAIRRGGLNRAEIGKQLRQLAPWQGASGIVQWDGLGSNTRAVGIATLRGGRVVPWKSDQCP